MLLYREQVKTLVTDRREVRVLEKSWRENGNYESVLRKLFPQGRIEGGCFRLSSSGETGRRFSFVLEDGTWKDFADEEEKHSGLISFLWELEGWDGLCRLARAEPLDFDWVVFNGAPVREDVAHRFAMKRGLIVAGKWAYTDLDGFHLGTRIRFDEMNSAPGKKPDKQFRLLSYRTRKVTRDKENRVVEMQEGWRLDGGWGPLDPLYITPEDYQSDKPILLVEGEKATEAARELVGSEFSVVTWGSGSAGGPKKAFWKQIENRPKIYWPDKDAPGKKSATKLCEIDKKTRVVQVWGEPELSDQDDLADVRKWDRGDKAQWVLDMIRDAPLGITPPSDAVGRRYAYIVQTEQFIDVHTGMRLSPLALRRAHMHEIDDLDEELLSDPGLEKVSTVTYWPGQELIVNEPNESGIPVRKYNLWRDTGCEAHYGEPEVFLTHMCLLIPDPEVLNHLLDWLAFIVQRPGEKILHAPLITGKEGIGKSYILRLMRIILGHGNVREITTEVLTSDFNSWAETSAFVVIEEIMAIGRREITNKLKPMVTSPTIEINTKGVKTYSIPNRMNIILFSNEEVPLLMAEDDRRFFVYRSPIEAQSEEYYQRLFDSLEEGEANLVRGYLERRDISKFNPNGRAPNTASKIRMQVDAESPVLSMMRAYMDARRTPFDADVVDLLDVADWMNGQKNVRPGEGTPRTAAKYLEKLGAKRAEDLVEGKQVKKIFVIRNHENYIPTKAS